MDKPMGRRLSVLVAAAVWATAATALLWTMAVPYLVASTGLGPPAGKVVVDGCWEATDIEGSYSGHGCKGDFTPAGADRSTGVVDFTASGLHRSGTVIEVWGAEGALTERYVGRVLVIIWATVSIAVVGWTPLVWLLSPLGRDDDADFERFAVVIMLSWGAVFVLGCVGLLFP